MCITPVQVWALTWGTIQPPSGSRPAGTCRGSRGTGARAVLPPDPLRLPQPPVTLRNLRMMSLTRTSRGTWQRHDVALHTSDRLPVDRSGIPSRLILFPLQEQLGLGLQPVTERPTVLPSAFEIQLVGPPANVVIRWRSPPGLVFLRHLILWIFCH